MFAFRLCGGRKSTLSAPFLHQNILMDKSVYKKTASILFFAANKLWAKSMNALFLHLLPINPLSSSSSSVFRND